jgi:hypothetical protein
MLGLVLGHVDSNTPYTRHTGREPYQYRVHGKKTDGLVSDSVQYSFPPPSPTSPSPKRSRQHCMLQLTVRMNGKLMPRWHVFESPVSGRHKITCALSEQHDVVPGFLDGPRKTACIRRTRTEVGNLYANDVIEAVSCLSKSQLAVIILPPIPIEKHVTWRTKKLYFSR